MSWNVPSFFLKDYQKAIGEIMIEKVGDTNELVCMNYTKFLAEWGKEGTVLVASCQ